MYCGDEWTGKTFFRASVTEGQLKDRQLTMKHVSHTFVATKLHLFGIILAQGTHWQDKVSDLAMYLSCIVGISGNHDVTTKGSPPNGPEKHPKNWLGGGSLKSFLLTIDTY